MAFNDGSYLPHGQLLPRTNPQEVFPTALVCEDLEDGASYTFLPSARIAVEFAGKRIQIARCLLGQVGDETLHQIPTRISQNLGSTEVRRVALYEIGIQFVLSNQ